MYSYFMSKGLLHENQFGFRKGHSTSHALNFSAHHIKTLLDKKQHVLGIFIDLSKAFDTIDHSTLISKLNHYGVRGNALKLISSYLSNRKQYVNVLGEKSEQLPVLFGVPQGSVLGPLLFIIYVNDLCNISDKAKFILFADDTNIFISANTKSAAFEIANEVLKLVSSYMTVNLLHINTKKCCYMYFSPNKQKPTEISDNEVEHYLAIDSKVIQRVSETKFLGVTIDENLTLAPHIHALNKKLNSTCGRLYRIKKFLPEFLHKQIYHALFESHLGYAISVWGGVSSNQIKPLFTTQKKCIRIMFGDNAAFLDKFKTCARARPIDEQRLDEQFYRKEPTKPIFSRHNILAVENLYRYRCLMDVLKILKYSTPVSLLSLFKKFHRKELLLITPTPSSQFIYKSSSMWNEFRKVAINLDLSSSVSRFKTLLFKSIMESQKNYGKIWCEKNFCEFL